MPIFDEVTQRITDNEIGRITGTVKGFSVLGAGMGLVKNAVGKIAPQASGALAKAMRGDLVGAALDGARQTAIGQKINGLLTGKEGTDLLFNGLPNPLLGGITPFEAAQIVEEVQSTNYARKNLYFIEITDYTPGRGSTIESGLFNLFCTGVSITPPHVTGEAHGIGSGAMDSVTGMDRGEIRLTSLDDAAGQIKHWFAFRKSLVVHQDGTFGAPTDYLLQIRILHAAINDEVMARFGGYEERYIVRPVSAETDLSRSDHGLQEIQMSFAQFDTFMFNQGKV